MQTSYNMKYITISDTCGKKSHRPDKIIPNAKIYKGLTQENSKLLKHEHVCSSRNGRRWFNHPRSQDSSKAKTTIQKLKLLPEKICVNLLYSNYNDDNRWSDSIFKVFSFSKDQNGHNWRYNYSMYLQRSVQREMG